MGKLPNQLVTSPESIKFIEDSHIRTERAEKVKEEKDKFCKEALAAKQKRKGLPNEDTRNKCVTECFRVNLDKVS